MTIQPDDQSPFDNRASGSSASGLESRAQSELGAATEAAKRDLDAVSQKAAEDVSALKDQAKDQIGAATEKAKSFASDQKALAANQIEGIASAMTRVADELDNAGDQGTIARYARDLAGGLTDMSKTIAGRDVDELMGIAQDFGRRQPAAFLGVAALAGFAASRFALASAHRRDTTPSPSTPQQSVYEGETSNTGSSSSRGGMNNVRS